MQDETVYKRDQKGKKIAKQLKPKSMRLKFKDRAIHIKRTITIGRDKNNDVVINDDPLISRRHATIEKDGPDYYIMDNGSTNGTYLNNNPTPRFEKVKIKRGDVITIGKTKLEIA